ncbi:beta-1,6-N-acetylglucosaminyltransferase [Rhizobacter fulvus]
MNIAYLIMAHSNPRHLQAMVETLSCEDCSFFVHIDNKIDIGAFAEIRGPNVFFIKNRLTIYWAEYSLVEATLRLIQAALDSPQRPDYLVLLSGSDFPLRTKEYIHRFFDEHRGREFISVVEVPSREGGIRLSHINVLRVPAARPVLRFVVRSLAKLGFARLDYRKELRHMAPYGGSQWWALSSEACRYVVDFAKDNPDICRFFAKTSAPDETFFHTVLANSRLRPRISRSVMYEDWHPGSPHPEMIGERHLAHFRAHDKIMANDVFGTGELLFARKFSDATLPQLKQLTEMAGRLERFDASPAVALPAHALVSP